MTTRLIAALVTSALAAALAPAARAQSVPQIYWTNASGNTIGSASVDGTGVNQDFIAGANNPQEITTNGQGLYWANAGTSTIWEAGLDGSGAQQTSIPGPTYFGVAVQHQRVYWSTGQGSIGEANLDGSDANSQFIPGPGSPFIQYGVAVNSQHVYWANPAAGTIGEANLDGTDATQTFMTGLFGVAGVAVDNRYIYWTDTNSNSIGRANLDGTGAQPEFITGADFPEGIAVDWQHIYWTNYFGDTIGEANLNGTDVNQSFIDTAGWTAGVAVSVPDAQVSPATPSAFADTTAGSLDAPQTLTISNAGARDLEVGDPAFTGADPGDFVVTSDGCLHLVAVGQSCQVTVAFAPQAVGSRSATLTIPTSDYANSPIEVPLTGIGTNPSVLTGTTMTCSTTGILRIKTTCTYKYTYSGAPTGPIGATVTCTSGLLTKTTSCTSTYTYAASNAATAVRASALATTRIRGRTTVVGTGTIRHHRLTLHFRRLKRGRHRLTLWRLVRHSRRVMIGRTTLAAR